MTKKELNKVYWLNKKIDEDILELRTLESLAASVKAVDYSKERVNGGLGGGDISDIVVKISDLKYKINREIDTYADLRGEIFTKISYLDNSTHRQILIMRHLEFAKWCDIADRLGYSQSSIFKLYRKALLKLSE